MSSDRGRLMYTPNFVLLGSLEDRFWIVDALRLSRSMERDPWTAPVCFVIMGGSHHRSIFLQIKGGLVADSVEGFQVDLTTQRTSSLYMLV